MKRLAAVAVFFAVSLWAADFWQSKPFTEWSDKDVQKILQNSPWSKVLNVSMSAPPMPTGGNGRRNRNPGNMSELDGPAVAPATTGLEEPGRAGTSGRGTSGAEDFGGSSAPSLTVTIRWQSSLAIKQALMRFKYGNEAGTSQEAKKMLEAPEPNYVLEVSGLPKTLLPGSAEAVKKALLDQSGLLVKGRDPIKPVEVITRIDKTIDAYIAFPRTQPLTVDDKDVEFLTKLNSTTLRQRFHLKDMMLAGKLEL